MAAETSNATRGLVLSFALVGLVGGWLSLGGPRQINLMVAIVTAVSCALLGLVARWLLERAWVLPMLVVVAGALNAFALLVLISLFEKGARFVDLELLPLALGMGMVFSLPFIPALQLVFLAARRTTQARRGSPVGHANQRLLVATTAAVVALAVCVVPMLRSSGWGLVHVLLLLAAAITAFAGACWNVLSLMRLRSVRSELAHCRDRAEDSISDGQDAVQLDLGLGDGLHERVEPAAHVYRDNDRPVVIIRGDIDPALAAVRQSAIWAVCAAAVTLAALASVQLNPAPTVWAAL